MDKHRRPNRLRWPRGLAIAIGAVAAIASVGAADDAGGLSADGPCVPADVVQVRLHPVELSLKMQAHVGASRASLRGSMEGREMTFTKDPDFQGHSVERGAIPTGSKGVLGFAWDESSATLYLDANRNRDLTDDRDVFKGIQQGRAQVFDNVRVTLSRDGIPVNYQITVTLSHNAQGKLQCTATSSSGWQGAFTAGDAEYRLTVVDNLDGVIDASDCVMLDGVTPPLPSRTVDLSQHLDLADRRNTASRLVYIPSFAFVQTDTGAELVAKLEPWRPVYGAVRLEGKSIVHILLTGPIRADLANPPETFSLPVGLYRVEQVSLQGGEQAVLPPMRVVVEEGKTAPLRVGGPLKHRVEASRSGTRLSVRDAGVVGIAGESYAVGGERAVASDARGFAVLKGDKVLTIGTFRYG